MYCMQGMPSAVSPRLTKKGLVVALVGLVSIGEAEHSQVPRPVDYTDNIRILPRPGLNLEHLVNISR